MIFRKIFPTCGLGLLLISPSNSAMLNHVGGLCFIASLVLVHIQANKKRTYKSALRYSTT